MKLHRHLQISALTFALVLGNNAPAFCRSPQNIPSQVQKVKDQVQKLGIAEDVTVILLTGKEYYGAIRKVEPDSFEIAEADLKQVMAFDYKDVKKVRKGYGGRGFAGKRVNPRNQWIAAAAVLGVLIVLPVIILASSKD
ncbi:MAG TPA: hypothetical protein VFS27_11780 [Blastocatellia bacterium]|jgi:hypothetical protein|nr:hypothetical protein [Blastocatellia bacterium]